MKWLMLSMVALGAVPAFAADTKPRPHGLAPVDLKQAVIWGSEAAGEDGFWLGFGGMDQNAADGAAHTRVKEKGEWKEIYGEMRKGNPLQGFCDRLRKVRDVQKELVARARFSYFEDASGKAAELVQSLLISSQESLARDLGAIIDDMKKGESTFPAEYKAHSEKAAESLGAIARRALELAKRPVAEITPALVREMIEMQINLEQAGDWLDCEPSPRALSPLLYRPGAKDFVLFGGDHLDYLSNDTWIFSLHPYRWELKDLRAAPSPRANHTLALDGQGQLTVTGGYKYANNTDYTGGQYIDWNDGTWTEDVVTHEWKNPAAKGVAANSRLYRSGPFAPDYFLETEKPDAGKFAAFLKELPANTWMKTNPPRLPKLNRDWGTAVLDTNRDLILRWAGGHVAHGGTDVLEYHRATNRWELCYPIEFPLGQLYSNTSYPHGVSFNGRAWITGHTYQSYAFDPVSGKMIFVGQTKQYFPYDPEIGDWLGGEDKPKGMAYGSCFYTLTCTSAPEGIYCWTNEGKLFFYDAKRTPAWSEVEVTGEKLAGSVVDNSTVVFDSKRDRLVFFHKPYGDNKKYDGLMQAVDLKTKEVSTITPGNAGAAAEVSYLCQIRYDAANDLLLAGCTLPPDATGLRRTPAYDPAANRWVSLKITGDDPSGKKGRNVSLGLVYDAGRKIFWAVDANSQVYVLRVEVKGADVQALR
jgi:hypothetical protein